MMIPLQDILNKYNVHPKGIIVVGAHWCEEHDEFVKCGIKEFAYIEPCKEAFDKIVDRFKNEKGVICYKYACSDREGEEPMYVSHQNQGQSNSLLEPGLHLQQHPEIIFDDAEIVNVSRLDYLPINRSLYDMLYLDVQGAEGLVLKGATETLKHIDIIYTEINRGQTYAGNMELDEMDAFLDQHGFVRVETHWPSPNWTWGDAIFLRVSKLYHQEWVTKEGLECLIPK